MERKNKNRQPFEPDRSDPADPAHEACHGLPSDSAADVWADDCLERDDELRELASRIERMPDLEPPAGLVSAVMAAVRGQRAPWWRRLHRWSHAPRTIVITPLSALAVVALLVLAPALALFWPVGGGSGSGSGGSGGSAGSGSIVFEDGSELILRDADGRPLWWSAKKEINRQQQRHQRGTSNQPT